MMFRIGVKSAVGFFKSVRVWFNQLITQLITQLIIGVLVTLSFLACSKDDQATDTITSGPATSENIDKFELNSPQFTAAEKLDYESTLAMEKDAKYQENLFTNVTHGESKQHLENPTNQNQIEIYLRAPAVGKQFLLVREQGQIRHVFAISSGLAGHSTPTGRFNTFKQQLWRHMSTKYPSSGENNMDHLTYFLPMYGLHGTTFMAYRKLGKKDSHGCVRLARPQARAVFKWVRMNGGNVKVVLFRESVNPNKNEVELIRKQLSLDFNLIQYMLSHHNRGDVPFNEKNYFNFLASGNKLEKGDPLLRRMGVSEMIEISLEQDLFAKQIPPSLARQP